MDKKLITNDFVEQIDQDLKIHNDEDRLHLVDWFMTHQLLKDKKNIALVEEWQNDDSPMKRRIFWYYQARLRWLGKTDHNNTEDLLNAIASKLADEVPEVQWAMNYTAGQIGKWQTEYRDRCIAIGEKTGLYKDEIVAKNCTPSYLPEFIRIEAAKVSKMNN